MFCSKKVEVYSFKSSRVISILLLIPYSCDFILASSPLTEAIFSFQGLGPNLQGPQGHFLEEKILSLKILILLFLILYFLTDVS